MNAEKARRKSDKAKDKINTRQEIAKFSARVSLLKIARRKIREACREGHKWVAIHDFDTHGWGPWQHAPGRLLSFLEMEQALSPLKSEGYEVEENNVGKFIKVSW